MAPHADDAPGWQANNPSAGVVTKTPFQVSSPNVTYTDSFIKSQYTYRTTDVRVADGSYEAVPREILYDFQTDRKVPKVGVMLVGWGGVSINRSLRPCQY